jgi:hypothetical protein
MSIVFLGVCVVRNHVHTTRVEIWLAERRPTKEEINKKRSKIVNFLTGERNVEERYPWGYHRSVDLLLGLGKRRKKQYLGNRWAGSL